MVWSASFPDAVASAISADQLVYIYTFCLLLFLLFSFLLPSFLIRDLFSRIELAFTHINLHYIYYAKLEKIFIKTFFYIKKEFTQGSPGPIR